MGEEEELWVSLRWRSEDFQFKVDKAKYSLMEWRGEIAKSEQSVLEWGMAFAVPIAAATAMIVTTNELIKSAEAYQEQVQQFAYITGMSTDATQRWRAAAIATDTDFGAFTQSMQYLNATIGDQGAAGEELRSTLDSLGIQYRDSNGDLVDNDALMKNILSRLGSMGTAQERDAAAKAILGRSWYNLAEMINEADTALVTYQNHDPAFSQEDLDAIDEYKTKWAELADQVEIAKARIALPIMNALLGIEDIGAKSGVIFSSMVMGVAGAEQWLTTGNAATIDEAVKRIMHPEQYTKEALEAQQAAALKGSETTSTIKAIESTDFAKIISGMSSTDLAIYKMETITLPALKVAWDKAIEAGDPGKIREAAFAYAEAERSLERMKNDVDSVTDAMKDYWDVLEEIKDTQQDLSNLTSDYYEDIMAADDPAEAMEIMKNYRRSKRSLSQDLGTEQEDLETTSRIKDAVLEEHGWEKNEVSVTIVPATAPESPVVLQTPDQEPALQDLSTLPRPFLSNIATGIGSPLSAPTSIPSLQAGGGDIIINIEGLGEALRLKNMANTTNAQTFGLTTSDLMQAGVRPS